MRRAVPIFVLLLLSLTGAPSWAGELALKRVMLSTGGVAYLEYEAAVDGAATLTLNVPLDQVDDVLTADAELGSVAVPGGERVVHGKP